MNYLEDSLRIITMLCFMYYMYKRFEPPKIREVKPEKENKSQKKKRPKYFRRIHLPYRGNAKIYKFTDKKHGYIESAWDEVQKPKKRK